MGGFPQNKQNNNFMTNTNETLPTVANEKQNVSALSVANVDNFDPSLLTNAGEAEEVTAEYLSGDNLTEGEEIRAIYMGIIEIDNMNGEGKSTAIKLLTDKKMSLINSSAKLVGALIDKPVGFMVSITYLGKKKSKSGMKYDDWKVVRLFLGNK